MKTKGADGLENVFLKRMASVPCNSLRNVLKNNSNKHVFPDIGVCKAAEFELISKSGDKQDISTYRGTSHLSYISTVLVKAFFEKFHNVTKDVLSND